MLLASGRSDPIAVAEPSTLLCSGRQHHAARADRSGSRKRKSLKRGQGVRVTLQTGMDVAREHSPDVLALEEALQRLAALDARKDRVIELKFLRGMTSEEIGQVLGISVATVGRELRLGQAWLRREMTSTQA